MGVESVNNPLVAQSVPELEVGSEEVSASVTSILPDLTPEFKTMGFNSLGVFGMQALSSSTTYTLADLGADLITFSTLAEAKKWAGADVETVYFRKVVVGGVTYLEPLKAKRSSDINYSKMDANELEFESAGDSIAFTATLPTASEFLKLHTAEQNALVALKGTSKTVSYTAPKTGSMTYIELVYSASGNEPAVTAILSQDGKKAYIVDKLQTRDFSFMPFDDQYAISKTAAFSGPSGIAAKLGLITSTATAVAAVQAAIDKINSEFTDAPRNLYKYIPPTIVFGLEVSPGRFESVTGEASITQKGYFTTEHRDLFKKQLDLIKEEISNDMAVFNMTAINDKIGAIGERFTRALAFGNIPAFVTSTSPATVSNNPSEMARFITQTSGTKYETSHGLDMRGQIAGYPYLLSADDNKTVKEGFDKFIAQEKIYHENAKSRRDLVKDISNNNLMLDAPTLLYRLQIHYNIESDANIACASEELRQQNDLLNSYSKAQQLISQTISINKKAFFVANNYGPEKNPRNQGNDTNRKVPINDEKWVPRYWGDVPRYFLDRATSGDDVLKRIAMFQTDNASLGGKAPLHPIEKMRGISRPYLKITGLKPNKSNDPEFGYGWPQKLDVATWQQYGNQLSETVNLIGQETQNVLNKISGFEKDKGRYTDMASNTLSKLNEAIMAIGRSL
ncbi:hypothetical protein [Pseudochelatococcus sp. G4_1912]|uniref:hypothetical protein n=1 Tax=Pseudochelatococcus sp. G4_1912 TaxID=3114288 RepID=UPI0039C6303C